MQQGMVKMTHQLQVNVFLYYSPYSNANIRLSFRSEFYGCLILSNLRLNKLTEL